jgi:phosphate transport system permease protein
MSNNSGKRRRLINSVMTTLTALCAIVVVGILFIIISYIAVRGITSINITFLIDTPKPVGEGGGIGNAIVGTLFMLAIASLMGMPVGIAAGIYLSEFGNNWFGNLVRFVTDTLTGVPSIVVGVFVYALIVIPQKHFSTLAGSVSLALIMIPIVTRTTEEMIRLVPNSLREGALALGAPQWRVTMNVVLPAAAPGIATGAMLAIARVAGETAPLLFTAFGSRFYNFYLDQPMASLTVQIFNYAVSPFDEWHSLAWAGTLVLMTMILVINIAVRFLTRQKF